MNILIPTHHFTDDPRSGLHAEIWNYALYIAQLGHRVFVVSTFVDLEKETSSSLKKRGIHLYHLPCPPSPGLSPSLAFLAFLFSLFLRIKYRFHWIIIIDATPTPFSKFKLGARLACRLLRPPTSEIHQLLSSPDWSYDRRHKLQEENFPSSPSPLWYRLVSLFANLVWYRLFPATQVGQLADLLLCQNQATLGYYLSQGFQHLLYLPNGVENHRIDQVKIFPGKTKPLFTYLFIGRLAKRKGIFYLIKAFKKLNHRHPQTRLIIIGRGSSHLTQKLKSQAGQLLNQKIFFLGELDRPQTIRHLKSCQVVVSPEIFATLPNVVLEALYCGKPVIGPKYGGASDIIQDGKNGFLVDPRHVKDLQQKMEFYLTHPKKAKLMATRGQRLIKSQFTWPKVIQSLNQAITAA